MKNALTLLLLGAVTVSLAAALDIETAKFAQASGVRIEGGAAVKMDAGQTALAKVVNVTRLASLGLKGAKNGDAVEVTLLEPKSRYFKLKHIPSNRAVTFNWGKHDGADLASR